MATTKNQTAAQAEESTEDHRDGKGEAPAAQATTQQVAQIQQSARLEGRIGDLEAEVESLRQQLATAQMIVGRYTILAESPA